MTHGRPARRAIHRTRNRRRRVAALLILIALAGALGGQVLAKPSSTALAPVRVDGPELRPPRSEHRHPPRERRSARGDGAIPAGTTVFDDGIPGLAKLDPALLGALREAAAHAAEEGVTFLFYSGWRSPEHQRRLLDEAIAEHGSQAQAARWVARPDRSAHVSGDAVDIGPSAATGWLSRHGAEHGLCQIYGNEPWHFELRPRARVQGCPPMYADPTHDPRLQP